MTKPGQPELRRHEPSANEELAAILMRMTGGDGRDAYELAKKISGLADFVSGGANTAGKSIYDGAKTIASSVRDYFNPSPFDPVDIETFKRERRTRRESMEDALTRADREARASDEYRQLVDRGQRRAAEALVSRMKSSAETTWRKSQGTMPDEERALTQQYEEYVNGLGETRAHELNKGFAERNPGTAAAMTVGGPILSAYLTRGLLNRRNAIGDTLVAEANAARGSGDPVKIYDTAAKLQEWLGIKEKAKTAGMVAAAATIPADLRMLTDYIDAKALPHDAGARKRAEQKYTIENLPNLGMEFGLGTISGLGGALGGAKMATDSPRIAATQLAKILQTSYPNQVNNVAGNVIALGNARQKVAQANAGAGGAPAPVAQPAAGAGNAPGFQPPPLQPPPVPPGPAYGPYDPAVHGPVSRQFLDEMLTHRHATRATTLGQQNVVPHIVQQLEGRYAAQGMPPVDPAYLSRRAQGTLDAASGIEKALLGTGHQITNPARRNAVLDAITGKDYTLSLPLAVAGGAGGAAALSADDELKRILGLD